MMMDKLVGNVNLGSEKVATGATHMGKAVLGGGAKAAEKSKAAASKARDAFADLMTDFKFPAGPATKKPP